MTSAQLADPPRTDRLILVAGDAAHGWRSRRGERMNHLFEERCDWNRRYGRSDRLAVDAGELSLTYDELDAHANQLARYLRLRGVGPGHRIALLFDQPVHAYLGMLAVLKINAAYVPLDAGFPADRMAYIVADAGVSMVLSCSTVTDRVPDLAGLGAEVLFVDRAAARIAEQRRERLTDAERGEPADELAYIIYTSGSTGRPKGVAIDHPSICNFVRVAAEVYGIRPRDRVYQGLTIAFDFSVEEIWVPWLAGATLVPKPAGASLLGADLHGFLTERRVTALCCVPTLLATVEEDLPGLRFLLVSGEACPQDLINRWWRPGRRFLNVYGPTEATVTATWTEVHPDKPVTIGVPLPTYATVILDPEDPYRALPHGEAGEIGIAGIGLACGYLNREDLTEKAFIHDFLDIPANPSGRIYRTGDLGRVNADGEIEYQGRIDLQVKIRGYRIELTEIESVLLRVPGIAQAVVDTYQPAPGSGGGTELVGYYSLRADTASVDQDRIFELLRERLPSYMVPAYLERLDAIPMTTSDKADRKNLPPPRRRAHRARPGEHVAAAGETEQALAAALAATLGVDRVSVDSHFFEELGANSLLMARFSARLRKEHRLASISMKELYLNPTVRRLAALLGDAAPTPGPAAGPVPAPAGAANGPVKRPVKAPAPAGGSVRYALTGVGQLLVFLAVACLSGLLLHLGFQWMSAAVDVATLYLRAVVFGGATFAGLVMLPILAKWLLVSEWEPSEMRLWSLAYLRFWLVKTMVRTNPMVLFAGSPLYLAYLRALGATIGKDVVIQSRIVPVATDLLTIGDGTVIRKNCSFTGYRAEAGTLRTGPVTLGSDVLVGEATVLDIDTAMADGAQLGHASSLHQGQRVPAGESWHGSPAEPSGADYRTVPVAPAGTAAALRKLGYGAFQVLGVLVLGPLALAVGTMLVTKVTVLAELLTGASAHLARPGYYLTVAASSLLVYLGLLVAGPLVMVTVPRLLNLFLVPGRPYPLYGLHHILQSAIAGLTNSRFLTLVLGDSSFIVRYLLGLGYDLSRVEQTGSNFGTELTHDSPFLTRVGTGTMVSDGLSIMNADYSSTSFRLSPVTVGARNFLGNNIAFPSGARTGANVLLATKVAVPVDGPVRENVGLLGSPCFEIPRAVPRPAGPGRPHDRAEVRRLLSRKNRHNARGIAVVLLLRWLGFLAGLLVASVGLHLYASFGPFAIAGTLVTIPLVNALYGALLERAVLGFRRLVPRSCSIYDRYFWGHERLWKLYITPPFTGTPFQGILWRLAGVRIGRRVFDDGVTIPEKTLVTIGDDVTLNAGSVIQCHSLEDGRFSSGRTVIGAGCTLGVKSFVHYDVIMGQGSMLESDGFLMKGEEVGSGGRWRGNPAMEAGGG